MRAFLKLKRFSEFYYKNYTCKNQGYYDSNPNYARKPIDRGVWINRNKHAKYPIQEKKHTKRNRETCEKDSCAQFSQLGEI